MDEKSGEDRKKDSLMDTEPVFSSPGEAGTSRGPLEAKEMSRPGGDPRPVGNWERRHGSEGRQGGEGGTAPETAACDAGEREYGSLLVVGNAADEA